MGKNEAYYHQMRRDIQSVLPERLGTVLDVGCAAGTLGAALKQRGAARVVGIEREPGPAAEARRVLDQAHCGDIETMDLPFAPESFDVIICADVLEHLIDPWRTAARLAALLRPETGLFVATLPNAAHFSLALPLLTGIFRYDPAGGILDDTHLRFFTLDSALALFESAGLDVRQVVPLVHERDRPIIDTVNYDYLRRDVLRLLDRFKDFLHFSDKQHLDVSQYFAYQFLFQAKKAGI